jgi:hypothetical protein
LQLYGFTAKLQGDMEKATFVSLQKRGVLALPKPMLRRHHLDAPGAQVEVIEREDGVIELHPHVSIPASQAWFWTPAWQEKVHASVAQIEAGEGQVLENEDDFLAALDDA